MNSNESHTLDIAVIVETRKHRFLIPVIKDTMAKIPRKAKIQIFHGTRNVDFIKEGLQHEIDLGKVALVNLNKKRLFVPNGYNKLLKSKSFWEQIPAENILIFQTDSCICNKDKLSKFLKYDYVGAPWRRARKMKGGNGGFSLRKKSAMLKVIDKYGASSRWEDKYFSNRSELNYCDIEESLEFSVETRFHNCPCGIHKPWRHLGRKRLNKLKKNCPEIKTIFNR
jgi:hypothetical protein